uniref:Uncharacterized protein n=1 Tax=viral metagenome TaxID=1070528 RepID=A0A6C0LJB9_9ZZZZ
MIIQFLDFYLIMLKIIGVLICLKFLFDIDLMEDVFINIRQYQMIKLFIDLLFLHSVLNII